MSLSTWADIATVFLAIQCFVIMLVPLVATFFLVRGVNMVGGLLPEYLTKAQGVTRTVRNRTVETSVQVTEPLLRFRREQTRMESAVRSFSDEIGNTIYGDREPGREPSATVAEPQGVGNES